MGRSSNRSARTNNKTTKQPTTNQHWPWESFTEPWETTMKCHRAMPSGCLLSQLIVESVPFYDVSFNLVSFTEVTRHGSWLSLGRIVSCRGYSYLLSSWFLCQTTTNHGKGSRYRMDERVARVQEDESRKMRGDKCKPPQTAFGCRCQSWQQQHQTTKQQKPTGQPNKPILCQSQQSILCGSSSALGMAVGTH